jgi:hypothetical protein
MSNLRKIICLIPFIILSCQNLNNVNFIENKSNNGISFKDFESKRYQGFVNDIKNKRNISKVSNISINVNQLSKENNFSILSNSYLRKKNYLNNIYIIKDSNKNIIFSPNEPSFYKKLKPYDGDLESGEKKVSSININNENNTSKFESEILLLSFKNSQAFNELKQKYDFSVLQEVDGLYKVKLNTSNMNIDNLEILINKFNQKIPKDILSLEFSSLSSLKTIYVLLDIIVNHIDKIETIELNSYLESQVKIDDWRSSSLGLNSDDTTIGSWWLTQTNILSDNNNWMLPVEDKNKYEVETKALSYSLGTNQDVAVIDKGFDLNSPEYKRRLNIYPNNDTMLNTDKVVTVAEYFLLHNSYPKKDNLEHGSEMSMIVGAEKNNFTGSMGVAPNVFISPYNYEEGGIYETRNRIKASIKNKSTLINISSGDDLSFIDYIFSYINGLDAVEKEIKKAVEINNIPVIVAGGNNSEYYKNFSYANLSEVSGVIVVGGVDLVPRNDLGLLIRSKPDFTVSLNSGFGKDFVWGPWSNYYWAVVKPKDEENSLYRK